MDIRLWRLGVAEDLNWTAGDEVRATCDVPKAGWRFERLPPGSYRVQCLDARYGVADPGMFSLTDGDHDVTLDVADRRTHRQRVSLVAQDGSPILSSASAAGGAVQALGGTPGAPTWVSPRSSKSRPPFDPRMGFGVGHKYSVDPPTPVSVEPDGWFALDPFFDRGPGGYHRWSWKYTTEGRASVYVGCDDALSRDIAFVGVAASLDTVVAGVSYPTGHPVNPGSVTIEAHCSAIQCAWDPPADAWRTIPVHVTVQVKGYEPLVFDWTAATADQRHVLVAKSPESQK